MLVTRSINNIEIDIDINKSNEIYFPNDFATLITDTGIDHIKKALYGNNNIFLPLSLIWELTNNCNFKCRFCYINTPNKISSQIYELHHYRSLIDHMISEGLLFCTLTGGECLTHPHFTEIYKYLKTKGVLVSVFTNGSLLTDEHIELFCNYKPYKIEISIYGIENETMFLTTNQTNVISDIVLNNIKNLIYHDINVICKTPINRFTEIEFKLISDWCTNNEIKYYSSPEFVSAYDNSNISDFIASEEVINLFEINEINNNKNHKNNVFSVKNAFSCSSGKYNFVLTTDFKIVPCMSAYKINDLQIQIKDFDFITALRQYRQSINKYKGITIPYCNGCTHEDICKECILTQYLQPNLYTYMKDSCMRIATTYK